MGEQIAFSGGPADGSFADVQAGANPLVLDWTDPKSGMVHRYTLDICRTDTGLERRYRWAGGSEPKRGLLRVLKLRR